MGFLRALFSPPPVLDTDPDKVTMMVTISGANYLYRNAAGRDIYESGYFYAQKNSVTGKWTFNESRCVTDESRVNILLADNLGQDAVFRFMADGENKIREKYGELSGRNVSNDWKLVQDALIRFTPGASTRSQQGPQPS